MASGPLERRQGDRGVQLLDLLHALNQGTHHRRAGSRGARRRAVEAAVPNAPRGDK
jgi:hypothetical protein